MYEYEFLSQCDLVLEKAIFTIANSLYKGYLEIECKKYNSYWDIIQSSFQVCN